MRMMLTTATCLMLWGCSALHWGGEAAGENPGFRVKSATLFTPAELVVTSDCNAVIGKAEYVGPTDTAPARFTIEDTTFGQSASAVMREEPAKIDAIGRLQMTQVEYARVTWDGVRGLAAELAPVLRLLALAQFAQTETGLTATLPNGLTLGGRTVTGPADLQEFFRQASATVEPLARSGSVPRAAAEGGGP